MRKIKPLGFVWIMPDEEKRRQLMCITEYNEAEALAMLSAQCEARGRAEGLEEGKILTLIELIKNGMITEGNAQKISGMSLDELKKRETLQN